ncbi:Peroxisome biosynthesis protein pex1 [Malassezia sp. CBS 17886]|nr:Peroxisome biosynthesis protein pex1 [Malassezia sp. CBS 17886]
MAAKKTRATGARVAVDASLRTSLVHLPASLCSTLEARGVVPQSLVVELGTDTQVYYCGWSALSAPPSAVLGDPRQGASDRVALSPALAALFRPPLADGDALQLLLFRSPPVPVAGEVHVTPLHADDWEILSIHAEDVEENMLAQVRAAKTGQVLAVQIGRSASTVVRFRVDKTVPATRAADAADDDGAAADKLLPGAGLPPAPSIAVRLSTDTEVIVAPATRATDAALSEPPEALLPADAAPAGPLTHAAASASLAHTLWRVLPGTAAPPGAPPDAGWSIVVPAAGAPANPDAPAYELAALAFPHGKLCVTRVACPSAEGARVGPGAGAQPAQPAQPTASASFFPGAPLPSGTPSSPGASPSPAPPARHVWVGAELRAKLGVGDFDLVLLSAPPPGATRGAHAKATPAPLPLSVPPPAHALPGMALPLARAVDTARHLHFVRTVLAAEQGCLDACADSAADAGKPPPATPVAQPQPHTSSSGVLLCGPPGSGKTSLARAAGAQLARDPRLLYATHHIDCAQFVEERMPLVRARFKEWLDLAAWHAPSLLVLDNVDQLVPADAENVDGTRSAVLAHALVSRIQAAVQDYDVFVLATAESSSSAHPALCAARVWTDTVSLKPPVKEARKELDWIALTANTDGYHAGDLKVLTQRAVHQATMRCLETGTPLALTMEDFDKAQDGFTPLSLRGVKLEDSSTNWSDIGGLNETRQVLRETLEWPTKYAAIFANCPLRLRSGLLLYGYPGCGKTLLASAVAKECGLNFISVKGPEILNKYIGASEKSVRDLFERAQAAKPCVLFFDEFDSIAPKRGHDSTGVTDRVVNQMLTQMDGAEGLDGVYVLAATSRPDLIDSALLRPGRLDKSLLCGMPSRADRLDILRAISCSVHVDPSVDLASWADRTDGFSGADLQALLYNAHLETINEVVHGGQPRAHGATAAGGSAAEGNTAADGVAAADVQFLAVTPGDQGDGKMSGAQRRALLDRLARMTSAETSPDSPSPALASSTAERTLVLPRHLDSALRTTRPSVPADEVRRLTKVYSSFAGDRDDSFPDGAPSNEIGGRMSLMWGGGGGDGDGVLWCP